MRIELSLLILAIALSGCAASAYVKPTVNVPTAYKEGSNVSGWAPATPRDAQDRGAWWEIFGNRQLNELESRVSVSNQTIQKALATLQQARAAVGVARSSYFPTLNVGTAAQRYHSSLNELGHQQLAGKTVNDYSVGAIASWEPDLFDKIGPTL
jgi:outer membrane protein TolC